MVRDVKIGLVLLIALWGLIGAAGNLAHWDLVLGQVSSVTAMPMLPEDAAPPWRTQSPLVAWLGACLILGGKIAALMFCGWGAVAMARQRRAASDDFQHAKRWALVGAALAVAMLFGGFIVIAESLFVMFRHPSAAPAGEAAFRYGGFIALIMIFVAQRD